MDGISQSLMNGFAILRKALRSQHNLFRNEDQNAPEWCQFAIAESLAGEKGMLTCSELHASFFAWRVTFSHVVVVPSSNSWMSDLARPPV